MFADGDEPAMILFGTTKPQPEPDPTFKNEFEFAAHQAESITDATKTNYRSSYKRIMALTDNKQVHTMSQDRLIAILNAAQLIPETKNQMISAMLLIRRAYNRPVGQLVEWRHRKLQPELRAYKLDKKQSLKGTLPSIAIMQNNYEELYRNELWAPFIINYLLVNHGFRNKDLQLIITRDKAVIRAASKARAENYIYITKTYCWVVVNTYKTKESYDQKKIKIRDRRFHRAALNHLGDRQTRHLLDFENKEGKLIPIADSSLNKFIQVRTYKELGEGKIFKAVIADLISKGNMKEVEKLAKSRGTNLQTIMDEYHINS